MLTVPRAYDDGAPTAPMPGPARPLAPHELTVSVTADGQGGVPDKLPAVGGNGLMGMRERAKLYGRTISIGPGNDGGSPSG
ncbi:ATP-binding protein [Streptomyces bottropensis]|uniref:ATP-binding protein n=1 Tax=Streptomyces bottropensis TaxID=42235 RepID=UPI0037873E60